MMTEAYSYACKDCEGMEACPASFVAATKGELWKLIELHASIAHGEGPSDWTDDVRDYVGTLIKTQEG